MTPTTTDRDAARRILIVGTGGQGVLTCARLLGECLVELGHYVVSGQNVLDGLEVGEYIVPDDHLVMLGDNSANSSDSRRFGPFPVDWVIGEPLVVFWPPTRWRTVR